YGHRSSRDAVCVPHSPSNAVRSGVIQAPVPVAVLHRRMHVLEQVASGGRQLADRAADKDHDEKADPTVIVQRHYPPSTWRGLPTIAWGGIPWECGAG